MNDAQSTIAGLRAQGCPGDNRFTVADCLADQSCGCIYGDAVQHIERLTAALKFYADDGNWQDYGDGADYVSAARTDGGTVARATLRSDT